MMMQTLLKFYRVVAIPMLLYDSECWTLTKAQMRRMGIAKMHFLRAIAGYGMMDHKHLTVPAPVT